MMDNRQSTRSASNTFTHRANLFSVGISCNGHQRFDSIELPLRRRVAVAAAAGKLGKSGKTAMQRAQASLYASGGGARNITGRSGSNRRTRTAQWLFSRWPNTGKVVDNILSNKEDKSTARRAQDGSHRAWARSEPNTVVILDRKSADYIANSDEGVRYYHFFKRQVCNFSASPWLLRWVAVTHPKLTQSHSKPSSDHFFCTSSLLFSSLLLSPAPSCRRALVRLSALQLEAYSQIGFFIGFHGVVEATARVGKHPASYIALVFSGFHW
jgi:hypothetical protein